VFFFRYDKLFYASIIVCIQMHINGGLRLLPVI